MLDYLKSIPGPEFLLMYIGYAICIIILIKMFLFFVRITLENKKMTFEDLTPLEVIVLKDKKGYKDIIKYYLYRLWKNRAVLLEGEGRNSYFKTNEDSRDKYVGNDEIECEILNHYAKGDTPDSIMYSQPLISRVETLVGKTVKRLEEKKYIKNNAEISKERFIFRIGILLLTIPAVAKTCMGISRGKPVSNLIFFYIASIVVYSLINKISYRTSNAEAKIRELKSKYSYRSSSKTTDEDLDYSMCLYGSNSLVNYPETILFGSILMEQSRRSFTSDSSSNNSSGGCSIDSGGSSDGGGGCSGGGCSSGGCSSGCGGCGGS
ncbi:hypothetical protein [Clostridium thailandense]|uniref:hypothetical protein n=1 Tax=Clostridium thailandense TaxID=2794346 RepID=UPI0039895B6A